ncbi:MAG: response regulator [Dissulfurispiraceae bacterium]
MIHSPLVTHIAFNITCAEEFHLANPLNNVITIRAYYEVLTALSGGYGLAILKEIEVSVIVSDQRMPLMTGAEFLEKSRPLSPDAVRIILTGYADVEAAIGAINRGGEVNLIP